MSASDGIAPDSLGFIQNWKAPEAQLPERLGDDTSWVGYQVNFGPQPITSTNPNGTYAGVSPMSAGVIAAIAGPDFSADGQVPPVCPGQ